MRDTVLRTLADLAFAHPRRILAITLAVCLVAGAFGLSVASRLDPYGAEDPASESVRADALIERATGADPAAGVLAVVQTPMGALSAFGRRRVARVAGILHDDPAIARVQGTGRRVIARDGRSAAVIARFEPSGDKEQQEAAARLVERFKRSDGVLLGGVAVANQQVNDQVSVDLAKAEILAFPLLLALSLLFFRGLVAALLPPLIGAVAIVLSLAALRIASEAVSISVFALNLATALGLGLAIDYSLFIVSRFREELAARGATPDALRATMRTAGRTVLFSSLTVAASLASLLVFPQRILYSLGVGGILVALIAAAVALVVLPAVLALLGARVDALAPARLQRAAHRDARPAQEGAWYRLTHAVMRRAARVAAATALVLVVVGLPAWDLGFTRADARVLPASASARQADAALRADFPSQIVDTATLVVGRGGGDGEVRRVAARAAQIDGVASVSQPRAIDDQHSVVKVGLDVDDPLGSTALSIVDDLRALDAATTVAVTGTSAGFADLQDSLRAHALPALGIVSAATLILLFLFTGSVVLPIKALLMNLLTLSATFGILHVLFDGVLEITAPLLLFAVAFGLSTDYGVFLLSRIKEARELGHDDTEAIPIALERTGRIITAAALLFSVAVGALVTSELEFMRQLGLGTALAVLIDATIIRALLVPALMRLLGRRNWWAPEPLRRLHLRAGLES